MNANGQLMTVITEDDRFEEVYQEKGVETNMCEYLDRLEARGEARGISIGEIRGKIQGTIATCLEFNLNTEQILTKIMAQFHLTESEAMNT